MQQGRPHVKSVYFRLTKPNRICGFEKQQTEPHPDERQSAAASTSVPRDSGVTALCRT
jgi:hypothetical protein